jgi:hypothetical protein
MTRFNPTLDSVGEWLTKYDLASKLEGWLITNDSDNVCCIAMLDDPSSMAGTPGWPKDFLYPRFGSDAEAIEFVRGRADEGSEWHARAVTIHEAMIPLSLWIPDPKLHEQILACCSAGPWLHGLRIPPFSADSQPCVFGHGRDLPLAILDDTDPHAAADVVLMAAAWELCSQLGELTNAAVAAENDRPLGVQLVMFRCACDRAFALLSRIQGDVHKSAVERYGQEEPA